MPRATGMRPYGFTMVELMVTVAVLAVITAFAIPSFKNLTLSNRLTAAADGAVAAINTARLEAIKRNASTQFCSDSATSNSSSTLGTACGTDAGAVVAMSGTTAIELRSAVPGIDGSTVVFSSTNPLVALRFSAQGLGYEVGQTTPYTGTVADICAASLSSSNHRVISMAAGSAITTTTSSGSCP